MSASAVRQIHAVISGALNLAVRWEWLDSNLARSRYVLSRSRPSRIHCQPPTPPGFSMRRSTWMTTGARWCGW